MPRKYNTIGVKHNIEVAHRLFLLPGKCENIHGHSMWVEFEIEGELNKGGILNGIEYGDLKKMYRGYLDSVYDHHLLLNKDDPWAGKLLVPDHTEKDGSLRFDNPQTEYLPGLKTCPGDPTTENIANWILYDMKVLFESHGILKDVKALQVEVWETSVNKAMAWEDYSE